MIEKMKFGHIMILGDIMLDYYISGLVERISPEAPVPVLLSKNKYFVAGGAANVAVNAASLGCKVSLLGVIGEDHQAQSLRDILKERFIALDGLVVDKTRPTTLKMRILGGQQQIVRIDEERTDLIEGDVKERLLSIFYQKLEQVDILICSDYKKGVLSADILHNVIEAAKERNIPVIIDPKQLDWRLYRGATLITPNRKELSEVIGCACLKTDEEIEKAASLASEQFGGDVLVTRSEDGMSLWQRGGVVSHMAAVRAEVSDVSGAGDTVVAVIAAVLSAGGSLQLAMGVAAAAAAIVVRKLGTAFVTIEELALELQTESFDTEGSEYAIERALSIIEEWRRHGTRIVFANGCFDLLHPGHISLLEEAARHGDKLVVALNSDASVRRLKGDGRPLQDQAARARVIGALRAVDMVVIFEEDTPLEIIQKIRPDIIVKGADYREEDVVGGDFVKSYGGYVVLADLMTGRSTSAIVKKMTKGMN